MPSVHSRCPKCRSTFATPPDVAGKRVRCRQCQTVFVARTEKPEPEEDADSTEEALRSPTPRKRRRLWPYYLSAAIVMLLLFCGGILWAGWRLLHAPGGFVDRVKDAAKEQQRLPQVEIEPSIADIHFGPWRKMYGRDMMGHEGEWLVADITAGDKPISDFDFQVEQFDAIGKKLRSFGISFPKLNPGERGAAQIRLEEGVAKIVIRPSDFALRRIRRERELQELQETKNQERLHQEAEAAERDRERQHERELREAEARKAEAESQRIAEENKKTRLAEQAEARKKAEQKQREAEDRKASENLAALMRRQMELQDAKAKTKLRAALMLLDKGFSAEARKRLQEIIDKYPGTPSAEKAEAILAKMAKD